MEEGSGGSGAVAQQLLTGQQWWAHTGDNKIHSHVLFHLFMVHRAIPKRANNLYQLMTVLLSWSDAEGRQESISELLMIFFENIYFSTCKFRLIQNLSMFLFIRLRPPPFSIDEWSSRHLITIQYAHYTQYNINIKIHIITIY